MSILGKFKRALRGEVSPRTAVWETVRRSNAALREKRERGNLAEQGKTSARLTPDFSSLSAAALLEHFQQRNEPHFFHGFFHMRMKLHQASFGRALSAAFWSTQIKSQMSIPGRSSGTRTINSLIGTAIHFPATSGHSTFMAILSCSATTARTCGLCGSLTTRVTC